MQNKILAAELETNKQIPIFVTEASALILIIIFKIITVIQPNAI